MERRLSLHGSWPLNNLDAIALFTLKHPVDSTLSTHAAICGQPFSLANTVDHNYGDQCHRGDINTKTIAVTHVEGEWRATPDGACWVDECMEIRAVIVAQDLTSVQIAHRVHVEIHQRSVVKFACTNPR